MFKKNIIKINNSLFKIFRRRPLSAKNILVLFPHCLQSSSCSQNITKNLDNCLRCGKCKVNELLNVRDEFQVECVVAAGGRQAVATARESWVQAIIAVACEKELFEGIVATVPKRVFAIHNSQPFGFCKNTDVDMLQIRDAILKLV